MREYSDLRLGPDWIHWMRQLMDCFAFLRLRWAFQVFDLSKLLRIWSFADAIPPAFYLGFK